MNSIYCFSSQLERFFPDLYIEELGYLNMLLTAAKLLGYDISEIRIYQNGNTELHLFNVGKDIQLYYIKEDDGFKALKYLGYEGLKCKIHVKRNDIIEGLKKVMTWL